MNEQYTYISQVYDKMIEMDYSKWSDFLRDYFNNRGINTRGTKALELGCGTGNMTLKLKELGFDVTGIDISYDMLQVAEEKLRLKNYSVKFVNMDMTDIDLSKKFDFIFSFCDGYNYILEEEDMLRGFEGVFNSLEEDGYFVFDVSTQYKLLEHIGNKSFTLNEDDLCYIWDNYIEDEFIEMYITFFVKEGGLYRRFDEVHYQRAYSIDYIVDLLKNVGFNNIEIYNDYENIPYENKSLRATFICRK
ncbi:MAG: class I SAM-dependent methyltransferase [Clostridium sp.]|uniref:class I SAM-dependent DNA methyltransferase n=1 Tax=Clostridium sp. TaxID=1506 RepID=UPI002FCAE5CA